MYTCIDNIKLYILSIYNFMSVSKGWWQKEKQTLSEHQVPLPSPEIWNEELKEWRKYDYRVMELNQSLWCKS